jgi:hypothetical protein
VLWLDELFLNSNLRLIPACALSHKPAMSVTRGNVQLHRRGRGEAACRGLALH